MRKFTMFAALLLAASAMPAMAMTPGQVNCPLALAPAGLGAATTDALLDFDNADALDPKVEAALSSLVKKCMAREQVANDQLDDYTNYVMSTLVSTELKARLTAQSIPTQVLDEAFDLGPGRRNPQSKELDKQAYVEIVRKMKAGGIDINTLTDAKLNDISTYVATTSTMYRLAATH